MPAYSLAVNDIIQMRLRGLLYGQVIRVVVNYRIGTAFVGNDGPVVINDLMNQFKAVGAFVPAYMAQATSDLTMDQLVGQRVDPVRQAQVVQGLAINGGQAPPALAANTGLTLIKYTNLATQRKLKLGIGGIGYQHLCGLPEAVRTGSKWNPFFLAAGATDIANKLNLPLVTAGGVIAVPTLWHRTAVGAPPTDTVQILPQASIRTERRRTVGVGE